ncbi:L-glutaminase [Arthrobacter alpinus]|uniref:Glutaminase n=1 Tax=Arthrobacter alpinus TaxID=656366 RepID=A0A0U2XPB2_9MICC|nr:glutaminase [Arthrobacter alpinus]ALV45458.1 glutaminase A [Arthrobacter alpinus]SEE18115.1 L-glutaminase [Arthrobacter alpinus]
MKDLQGILNEIADTVAPLCRTGEVAAYIPSLGEVSPDNFGMCVAMADGSVYGAGDWRTPFSIQSISKVFSLALVMSYDYDSIWKRVFREPSGTPFNSMIQLEADRGIPRNPFINAGALVVTDRLLTLTGDAAGSVRGLLRRESGNPAVDVDLVVAASEADHGHRNASMAHLLASYGNLENPVELVLENYFNQSALEMSCEDLAKASLFLARHGVSAGGTPFLTPNQSKRVNAVMLTCGTYDAAGEFAYRVGLPGKSGVGGGIVATVPGRCSITVWGPALGPNGNSVAGVAALDAFTTLTGWSIF